MYIDPITTQTFIKATPISCDNNPQNVIAIDSDEHYALTPKAIIRAVPTLLEPKQVQSAIGRNTFTGQKARFYSIAELTNFRNSVSFTKRSDATLKFLGKAIYCDFLAASKKHPTDSYSTPNRNRFNPWNVQGSVHKITSKTLLVFLLLTGWQNHLLHNLAFQVILLLNVE